MGSNIARGRKRIERKHWQMGLVRRQLGALGAVRDEWSIMMSNPRRWLARIRTHSVFEGTFSLCLSKRTNFRAFQSTLLRLWFANECETFNMNERAIREMCVLFHTWECNCEFPDRTKMIYTHHPTVVWISIGGPINAAAFRSLKFFNASAVCFEFDCLCVIRVADLESVWPPLFARHLAIWLSPGIHGCVSWLAFRFRHVSMKKQLFLVGIHNRLEPQRLARRTGLALRKQIRD